MAIFQAYIMKQINLIVLTFLALACNGQIARIENTFLTVSPIINKEEPTNKLIISALNDFLKTKNKSLTENELWLKSDFHKYVYPYIDIYNIEQSKFGKDFYKPTLMEVLPTDNEKQKIVKIAFIGHNQTKNENLIKSIYNIVANIENEKIVFSRFIDFATQGWTKLTAESINYVISPNKKVNNEDITKQKKDINLICDFFETEPITITYFSCVNPKELFEVKGFDYNPMMYVDKTGGLADYGNIVFSGNNAEIYTHEIVHIYTSNIFPKIDKFIDEGIATYIAGSGKYDYEWHRKKLMKFISENPEYNFADHFDPYERLYFENETSIPYLTSALICERTIRIYGKEKLMQLLKSEVDIWTTLKSVGLAKDNINEELRKQIKLPLYCADTKRAALLK